MHVFPLSRFIIDAERLENDPLKTKGQGILYTDFEGFHREIAPEVRDSLMNIYHKYIQQIRNSLAHNAILVDCHSFPQGISDVDVCIGFNEDWSKPEQQTIDIIAKKFYKAGYKVGINNPYSNSLSPTCDFTYHSLMIEVNKRIYIDSVNHHLLPDADKFTRTINEIYAFLLHQESNRIKKLMELSIKKSAES
jgi:N-formylglutamate amidohydrolase